MESSLISIFLITIGILFVPFFSKVFKIPVAVGEVIYGILIGKTCFNFVESSELIDFLSNFGFLLLMFIAGLEVKFVEIRKQSPKTKILTFIIPTLVFLIALILGSELKLNFLVSLVVGAISVGVVVSVLREREILNTRYGKTIFLIGIVGEVISILLLTLASLYSKYKFSFDFWIGIVELILFFIVSRIVLLFLRSFVWWYPNRFKFFFERNPSEIGVRISLAVMFLLSIDATLIHIEPIIGAFIAGVIFATVFEETENIEEKLSGISFGFLIPIFFIHVGIEFQMPNLDFQLLKFLLLLTALSFLAKVFPSVLLKLEGFSLTNSIAVGFLLSAPLTLVIVISEVGVKLGVIDHHTEGTLILLAVLTGILAPTLFNLLYRREDESSNT